MRRTVLTICSAALLPTPATAQSEERPLFTGPRVEAVAGFDTVRAGSDLGLSEGESDGSVDGLVYGIGAGFDFDLGRIVIGAEGEFSDSTGGVDLGGQVDGMDFSSRFDVGNDLYVGVRLGVQAAASTLVYAKAGYTNAEVEIAARAVNAGGEALDLRTDTDVSGYRLGAGVERLFGPSVYGKLEYRYSNYRRLYLDDEDDGRDLDGDRHQAVIALGVRF